MPLAMDFPGALGATWAALVGAVVGSFLNVVIARLPAGESVVRPRSRCPKCLEPIAWYDNIPIVSWLLLRARCRRCGARISVRYPLVEALGAAAGLLAWQRHGPSSDAAAELLFAALLVALAFIDLDTWLLPHALTWPLIGAGLAASALGIGPPSSFRSAAAGSAVGFVLFALASWLGKKALRKEALGFGDVWLLSGIGAWLGIGALLPVVLLASIQGSVVGVALVLLGRAQPGRPEGTPPPDDVDAWVPPRHAVPFGPFLAAGALEWLYLSAPLAGAVPALQIFR